MIKSLFFAVALTTPWAAFAAAPSANLSVKIVAAGARSVQCPATAPAEAAQAGFTTMAFCNDFTLSIPNAAGTGLPSNWLGCPNPNGGAGDNLPHVWYSPEKDQWTAPPCNESGGGISQVTDPTFGNLALDVAYSLADNNSYAHEAMTTMSAAVTDPTQTSQQSLFLDFPLASYIEIVARDTTNNENACGGCSPAHESNADFFAWSAEQWSGQCYQNGQYVCQVLESDVIENWGDWANGTALHNWGAGGAAAAAWQTQPSNEFDVTQYHAFGTLITTNGNSDVKECAYIDHVLKGCLSMPGNVPPATTAYDGTGTYAQRNTLAVWSDNWNYPGVPLPNPLHYYIKSIAVWSCQDWKRGSTGPNPHYFGGPGLTAGSDGSQFYELTTQ